MSKVGVVAAGLLTVLLAGTPLATAQIPTYYYTYNRWSLGGPALWGNLTFNGAQGGISWAENPPSEDGPADTTDGNLYNVDGASNYYTGSSAVPINPRLYEFTSTPLPQTLFLNASRNIQLEVMFSDKTKANPCPYAYQSNVNDPNMEVRLTANGKIIGGALADDYHVNYIHWYWFGPPYSGPSPPNDWTTCRFAFAPETHILDQGTVLKLELIIHDQDRAYQVGATGDHRSTIKFNLLPPEEVLFRFPEFAEPEPEEGEDAGPQAQSAGLASSAGQLASAGLVVLGLALPMRRGSRAAVLMASLLLTMALGGCVGSRKAASAQGDDQTLEGGVDNTFIRSDGQLTSGALGSIVGQIHDDLHIPVSGVHVSMIGLANFTQSDGKGRFQFLNVIPGVYKLRFDKKEYKSFEADIEVKGGFVSRPQITLYLANEKDRDARQHSHDYWAPGQTSKELMNAPLLSTCATASVGRCDYTGIVRIPPKAGEMNTVIPGTRMVQIVLDWNPADVGWDRLALAIRHNGDTYAWNQSVYAPRGPGQPFNVATTWEMSDPGHQLYSSWEILVMKGEPYSEHGYVDQWAAYAYTDKPAINMKVSITKGSLPLEAGHPDRWGLNTKVDIVKNGYSYWYNCSTPKALEPTLRCYGAWEARFYPQKVVPKGTGELEVKANWNRAPTFPIGGIAWTPDPPSEDNPALDTRTAPEHTVQWYVEQYGGRALEDAPPTFSFTSAPLPKALNLNVSRNIQVELAFADPDGAEFCNSVQYSYHEDPDLEIQLKVGDRVVAGLLESDYVHSYIEWWYFPEMGHAPPPNPDGYCVSRFAIAAEVPVLNEGAVLVFDLTFHNQQRSHTLGLQGEHRSTIRFPLYDSEEILFRNPTPEEEVVEEDEPATPAASNGAASVGLGALAVSVGLARGSRPRRMVPRLLCLALLAMTLGGCVGSKASGPASTDETLRGRLDNTFVAGGDLVSSTLGAIVGRIHDDLHVPLAGVHVSLLGFTNFTDTDGKGQFKFLGLLPAVYKLRFDKKEYTGFEADVEVKAGKVSRPSIMLYLSDPKERDRRPHSHDYWGAGELKREIMNQPLPTTCPGIAGTECTLAYDFHVPPKAEGFAAVLPGTADVEVVLEWSADTTKIGRIGLAVGHNGDPYAGGYNRSIFAPRGPGQPFHIATSWEMADAGHQPYSSWTFQPFMGDVTQPNGYADAWADPRPAPAVTARITVHRGLMLPLEPGHKDWWGDKTQLDVFKNLDGWYYGCLAPEATEFVLPCTGSNEARWQYLQYYGGKTVPPGTGRIEFDATLNRAPTLDMDWHLYYKPANVQYPFDYYSIEGFKDAGAPTIDGQKLKWKFNVKEMETDPEYAKVSTWGFVVRATNGDNAWVDYMASLSNLGLVYEFVEIMGSARAYRTGA